MRTAIFPGSFDPITVGHINIIERALAIFDNVIVVIGYNPNKKTMFDEQKRFDMAIQSLVHLPNVDVVINHKLTIEVAQMYKVNAIIRGIRTGSDLDFESQIAITNKKLCNDIETIFLLPDLQYAFVSSSAVRELLLFGQDISNYVSPVIHDQILRDVKNIQ